MDYRYININAGITKDRIGIPALIPLKGPIANIVTLPK